MTEQHTQGRLTVGRTLRTRQTERWTDEEVAHNDAIESRLVFAHFTAADEGRGRFRVAECREPADAAELVRRWNAFEPGGAVAGAVEALNAAVNYVHKMSDDDADLIVSTSDALAALVESGAGAGKEPQG